MRKFGQFAALGASALALLLSGSATAIASSPTGGRNSNGNGNTHCIAPDTKDLTPTLQAPDWYVPGVTKPCNLNAVDDGIVPFTAYWVGYAGCGGNCSAWRTTPDNADYSANDCVNSYTTCGTKIIGDAADFYYTCHDGRGLSGSQVATNIRYWADRARANGTDWRVYTFTENGGYPYTCEFSVVQLP
jgi:hypothetical protein